MSGTVQIRRHQGLDALRGVLMAAVIIGHFPTSAQGRNPFGPVPGWIYFIHIPLFLALSCLFVKPFTLPQLRRRAVQILVPYGAWVAFSHPWRVFHAPAGLLRDAAMGNWGHLQSVLWFLPALFTTNLLLALWRRTGASGTLTGRLAWAGILALAVGAWCFAPPLARCHDRIPFGLDVAFFLLPFLVVLGRAWEQRERALRAAGRWLVPAALLALALGATLIQRFEPLKTHSAFARRVDFAQFSVPETIPGYLGMGLMGVALLALAARLPAPRILAAVGRCSLPIYLLHYPLLFALTRSIGLAGENPGLLLVYGFAVTILVIALAMLVSRVLTRILPGAGFLGLAS